MTSSDVVSTAACWLTLSFQAAFTLENILLTACYMVVLHLAATHFPDWSWLLGPKTLDSHAWTTKAKKTVCFICLHLVSITLAAAFQLGAAIASRGFREGPHSDKGYWYLLQSTRFIVASYWAEMLFNESIRMPMIVHHLITNLIIGE
ncbi:hypothetical protein BCV69DRAFT_92365 [Microstroma glucosiphilum]|uniref:TLC domain-containing protein n=1 Tax=Pseudomicrostroma glucosiphilum TaxID=1684307 RepID=A0A316UBK9_9BASI|nr:hypothetical protein BCV69DRAFT_92365 [Pseudomicrostroma glucosiphilum]PWN22617.1 hypothetical protein BCV69DRAFT_92365 [Pseudomicrostroma glucosiphilum]